MKIIYPTLIAFSVSTWIVVLLGVCFFGFLEYQLATMPPEELLVELADGSSIKMDSIDFHGPGGIVISGEDLDLFLEVIRIDNFGTTPKTTNAIAIFNFTNGRSVKVNFYLSNDLIGFSANDPNSQEGNKTTNLFGMRMFTKSLNAKIQKATGLVKQPGI